MDLATTNRMEWHFFYVPRWITLGEIGRNSEDDFPVAQVEDAKKVYGFFGALNIRILQLNSNFVCDVGGTFFLNGHQGKS